MAINIPSSRMKMVPMPKEGDYVYFTYMVRAKTQ
jgi:hypothetical protein